MNQRTTVHVEGIASAQLVRPDVAQPQWLTYPFAARVWSMGQRLSRQGEASLESLDQPDPGPVFVEQSADFDAWRVGGGVAFRW